MATYISAIISLLLSSSTIVLLSEAMVPLIFLPNTVGYSISIPPVLTSNSSANICLDLHTVSDFDGELEVSLITNAFISKVIIQPFQGRHKCFSVFVPPTDHTTATLQFEGHFDNGNFLIVDTATVPIKKVADFSVDITVTPKIIFKDVQQITLKVCARYNNGTAVLGRLRATSSVNNQNQKLLFVQSMGDECYSANVSREILRLDNGELTRLKLLNITADVTDNNTKTKVSSFHQVEIKGHREYVCQVAAYDKNLGKTLKIEIRAHDGDNKNITKMDKALIDDRDIIPIFCPDEKISTLKSQIAEMEVKINTLEASKAEMNLLNATCTCIKEIQNNSILLNAIMESKIKQAEAKFQKKLTEALKEFYSKLNASENKIGSWKSNMTAGCSDIDDFFIRGSKQNDSLTYSWKMTNIKDVIDQKIFEQESPVFPLEGYHFGAKFQIEFIGNRIALSMSFVDFNNTRKPIDLKVMPEIVFIVRDQSGDKNYQDIIRNFGYITYAVFNYDKYFDREWIYHPANILESPYTIGDSLLIDIFVAPPSNALNEDGVMTCKISQYQKKKVMEEEYLVFSQTSPNFYTSSKGYLVKVRMYVKGYEDFIGKGLTAEIVFLLGEFDSSLSHSFNHKTTITIFNQRDSTRHLVKTVEKDIKNDRSYQIDIALNSVIENDGFLVNDALIYKVVIESI